MSERFRVRIAVRRGAGLRLGSAASPEQIRMAIERILHEPSYRDGARRLGAVIASQDGTGGAADELESLLKLPA